MLYYTLDSYLTKLSIFPDDVYYYAGKPLASAKNFK